MSRKVFDAVATVGEYTNGNGETKKRYMTVGAVFENKEGQHSLKLECVPVGPDWSGWISFYPPKERAATPPSEHSKAKANGYQKQQNDFEDDIPF